jgi:tetratricopeptide (TPR) repeat protein
MGLFETVFGSFWTAGQFASGRRAFIAGKYAEALALFQRVAAQKPDYIFSSGNFRQGLWSYIGRCHYYLGEFADARYAFERALIALHDDHLAHLSMGLTLARQRDYTNATREIVAGMEGLRNWIEDENSRDPSDAPWDPRNDIGKEIIASLAAVHDKNPDWPKLIERAEFIALKTENEIELVRRDRSRRHE